MGLCVFVLLSIMSGERSSSARCKELRGEVRGLSSTALLRSLVSPRVRPEVPVPVAAQSTRALAKHWGEKDPRLDVSLSSARLQSREEGGHKMGRRSLCPGMCNRIAIIGREERFQRYYGHHSLCLVAVV
jgi:hypothetical protein